MRHLSVLLFRHSDKTDVAQSQRIAEKFQEEFCLPPLALVIGVCDLLCNFRAQMPREISILKAFVDLERTSTLKTPASISTFASDVASISGLLLLPGSSHLLHLPDMF